MKTLFTTITLLLLAAPVLLAQPSSSQESLHTPPRILVTVRGEDPPAIPVYSFGPVGPLMRIRVIDVLDYLASGMSREQILEELPDLEPEDIDAALKHARASLDHPVLVA